MWKPIGVCAVLLAGGNGLAASTIGFVGMEERAAYASKSGNRVTIKPGVYQGTDLADGNLRTRL